jgi:mRNA-degrading endonuclease toxin of MazEF toxin-antitoxin module
VLVLSPDARNLSPGAHSVIAAPLTTRRRPAPFRVPLSAGAGGAPRGGEVACEQIAQLDKDWLSAAPLGGPLSAERLDEVVRAVLVAIGAGADI